MAKPRFQILMSLNGFVAGLHQGVGTRLALTESSYTNGLSDWLSFGSSRA